MSLGMPEMIFIFLLALILFGPKKLPEIGREIGKFMTEFKRASNEFAGQLQTEIEKVDTEIKPTLTPGAQQSSAFTQILLPPAVSSAISEITSVREQVMHTPWMAFDARNFTLPPPDSPVAASTVPESLPAPLVSENPEEVNATVAKAGALDVFHGADPVEVVADRPSPVLASGQNDSAAQSS